MRTLTLALAAAGAFGATFALGQPPPKADPPAEQVRTIPLETCYATFGGSGCQLLSGGRQEPEWHFLNELFRSEKAGASNVALVGGKDIVRAVRATFTAFHLGFVLDTPVFADQEPETKAEPFWLAANLGVGLRQINAVTITGRTIRVTHTRVKRMFIIGMYQPYLLWVPLGRLTPGMYTLELFDADRKEVMLLRRVAVV